MDGGRIINQSHHKDKRTIDLDISKQGDGIRGAGGKVVLVGEKVVVVIGGKSDSKARLSGNGCLGW